MLDAGVRALAAGALGLGRGARLVGRVAVGADLVGRERGRGRLDDGRAKVSFYQERADTDRIRGAILHTMATEGSRSLSQFINQAVMAEVERLERKYNGGQPFPAVGARELPQGRPMGE